MAWTITKLTDVEAYQTAVNALEAVQDELNNLDSDIESKANEIEDLKQQSVQEESPDVSWEDVQQARHEKERLEYQRAQKKEERDQAKQTELEERRKARQELFNEGTEKKMNALKKAYEGYKAMDEARKEAVQAGNHVRAVGSLTRAERENGETIRDPNFASDVLAPSQNPTPQWFKRVEEKLSDHGKI